MELRHLRYFVAVAEELHFGRAAERLHIAQPPLSRQIRDLEREVGTPLFERVPRGVELTPAGRAFLGESRLVLAQAERALRTAQRAARGEVGRLRVGFAEAATYAGALPSVLGFFRSHLPNIGLSLFELDSPQQWDALREARIDVGLLHALPPDAARWLVSEPVLADPLLAAVPAAHPLARGRAAVADLEGEPLVLFPRPADPALYDAIVARCRAAGFSPAVAQVAEGWHTLVALAGAGVGVALVPRSMARLERPDVVYRPVRGLSVKLALSAAWRRGDRQPGRERFVTALRAVASARPAARGA
ncbi:LysR substrate-binding domain-containing protein, partial [Roseisolibacter sp. H3M3-2]|uniref:LysR substrate-binding domain-containing protein n=1 Tax=Roseisolibacter sp. H3M3-2 TaxID=3031323 RepID=UPI0023DA31B5